MTKPSSKDLIGKRVTYHPAGALKGFSGEYTILEVDEENGTLILGTTPRSNMTFCGVKGEDCTLSEDTH